MQECKSRLGKLSSEKKQNKKSAKGYRGMGIIGFSAKSVLLSCLLYIQTQLTFLPITAAPTLSKISAEKRNKRFILFTIRQRYLVYKLLIG